VFAVKCSDCAGNVTLEARAAEDLPERGWVSIAEDTNFSIVSDLRKAQFRFAACWPDSVDVLDHELPQLTGYIR